MQPVETINLNVDEGLAEGFLVQRFENAHWMLPNRAAAHRHNFQEILLIVAGQGRQLIDSHTFAIQPPVLTLIAKSQIHFFEYADGIDGWLVRFTDDFLPTSLISHTWNYHATLFNRLGPTQALMISAADVATLTPLLELLHIEQAQPQFHQSVVMRHLLAALIIRIERLFQTLLSANAGDPEQYRIYQGFMTLLERDFSQHHAVHYYAERLGITPARLSKLLTAIVGKGTKQLIDERIILEAKRYLLYTDLAVGAIAFALGYADQFQFSKAFKRLEGSAPQRFRETKMTSGE